MTNNQPVDFYFWSHAPTGIRELDLPYFRELVDKAEVLFLENSDNPRKVEKITRELNIYSQKGEATGDILEFLSRASEENDYLAFLLKLTKKSGKIFVLEKCLVDPKDSLSLEAITEIIHLQDSRALIYTERRLREELEGHKRREEDVANTILEISQRQLVLFGYAHEKIARKVEASGRQITINYPYNPYRKGFKYDLAKDFESSGRINPELLNRAIAERLMILNLYDSGMNADEFQVLANEYASIIELEKLLEFNRKFAPSRIAQFFRKTKLESWLKENGLPPIEETLRRLL